MAKAILTYSANPGLAVVNYHELVLFCFLTDNVDMHLRNFSPPHTPGLDYGLAPAYDLVAPALVNLADKEEVALTLNGQKKKLNPTDSQQAAQRAGLLEKVVAAMFRRFTWAKLTYHQFINSSFLTPELRHAYHALLNCKFEQLELR